MKKNDTYIGLDQDQYGGMTDIGRIVRDARAFGLIDEQETCAGWVAPAIEKLWINVQEYWREHGYSVAKLPEDVRTRYLKLQEAAVAKARHQGWNPDYELEDD
ncbi:MAG: hypothetical protein ACR2HF_09205 [Methylococcaceae bacterium]